MVDGLGAPAKAPRLVTVGSPIDAVGLPVGAAGSVIDAV